MNGYILIMICACYFCRINQLSSIGHWLVESSQFLSFRISRCENCSFSVSIIHVSFFSWLLFYSVLLFCSLYFLFCLSLSFLFSLCVFFHLLFELVYFFLGFRSLNTHKSQNGRERKSALLAKFYHFLSL